MATQHQTRADGPARTPLRPESLGHLDVREQLNLRIQQEVEDLQRRIAALQRAHSLGSESIIATYTRMIENKRQFLLDLDD